MRRLRYQLTLRCWPVLLLGPSPIHRSPTWAAAAVHTLPIAIHGLQWQRNLLRFIDGSPTPRIGPVASSPTDVGVCPIGPVNSSSGCFQMMIEISKSRHFGA